MYLAISILGGLCLALGMITLDQNKEIKMLNKSLDRYMGILDKYSKSIRELEKMEHESNRRKIHHKIDTDKFRN